MKVLYEANRNYHLLMSMLFCATPVSILDLSPSREPLERMYSFLMYGLCIGSETGLKIGFGLFIA